MEEDTASAVDGRTARRERGKVAVLEAILDLVDETDGVGEATPEEIASRAGVSVASLFRYFGTLDGMRQAASEYWFEKNDCLVEIPEAKDEPFGERVDRFLRSRLTLFEASKPAARRLRRLAINNDAAQGRMLERRASRLTHLAEYFEPELAHLTSDQSRHVVAIISTLTSHEALLQLTEQDGMTFAEVMTPLNATLTCLLGQTAESNLQVAAAVGTHSGNQHPASSCGRG